MNKEEIHKALEIIKQPITVNCKEYKYFDQENYDKLVSVYNNCLWFIRNFEQVNTTVERVQQENQQLKERIEKAIEIIESYNLGKYDYSIPLGGIDELLETLKEKKSNGIRSRNVYKK